MRHTLPYAIHANLATLLSGQAARFEFNQQHLWEGGISGSGCNWRLGEHGNFRIPSFGLFPTQVSEEGRNDHNPAEGKYVCDSPGAKPIDSSAGLELT
jgi:hypothetical protein